MFEPPALIAGLDDIAMVGHPVRQALLAQTIRRIEKSGKWHPLPHRRQRDQQPTAGSIGWVCAHGGHSAGRIRFSKPDKSARYVSLVVSTSRDDRHRLALVGKFHHDSAMLDWSQCSELERISGKVGGAWLFKNSRVPVKALFENIEGGATVQDFLEWFPGVTREQVDAVLEYARRSLDAA